MELSSLRQLHQSMIAQSINMQQFSLTVGSGSFDCLFSTREQPFIFSMTSRGGNPQFFIFDVKEGYRINTYLGNRYTDLLAVLNTGMNSKNKLQTNEFFADLNKHIPIVASRRNSPLPEDIVRLRSDLEENHKPYFDTWIYWDKKSTGEDNKQKTLVVLGSEALDYSIRMNASSKWSVTPTSRNWKSEMKNNI